MIKIEESKGMPFFTEIKCGGKKCIFDNKFSVRFCTEFHFTTDIEIIKQAIRPLRFDSIVEDRESLRLCLMLTKRGATVGMLLLENKTSEDLKAHFRGFGFDFDEIVI